MSRKNKVKNPYYDYIWESSETPLSRKELRVYIKQKEKFNKQK